MKILGPKEMAVIEKVKITKGCYVSGVFKKVGEIVSVSGNDKAQLLASGKGELVEESGKTK